MAAGHFDIQEERVTTRAPDVFECYQRIAARTCDLHASGLLQEPSKTAYGQWFVID
jgi:hypothetical protein